MPHENWRVQLCERKATYGSIPISRRSGQHRIRYIYPSEMEMEMAMAMVFVVVVLVDQQGELQEGFSAMSFSAGN